MLQALDKDRCQANSAEVRTGVKQACKSAATIYQHAHHAELMP